MEFLKYGQLGFYDLLLTFLQHIPPNLLPFHTLTLFSIYTQLYALLLGFFHVLFAVKYPFSCPNFFVLLTSPWSLRFTLAVTSSEKVSDSSWFNTIPVLCLPKATVVLHHYCNTQFYKFLILLLTFAFSTWPHVTQEFSMETIPNVNLMNNWWILKTHLVSGIDLGEIPSCKSHRAPSVCQPCCSSVNCSGQPSTFSPAVFTHTLPWAQGTVLFRLHLKIPSCFT